MITWTNQYLDELEGEDVGCGGTGLVWLHVVCGCDKCWMFCQILLNAFGDGLCDISKDSLVKHLEKLECHFTWMLKKEDCDIDDVVERIRDQITFDPPIYKHRNYNLLAYVKYLTGEFSEVVSHLQKAEEHVNESQFDNKDAKKIVIYANFAWFYLHTNQLEDALSYAEKVDEIQNKYQSSENQSILFVEIYGEQAWSLLGFCGQYCERAVECFKQALIFGPEEPDLNSGHAMAEWRLLSYNRQSPQTEDHTILKLLGRAVKLNPKDVKAKVMLGLAYQALKESEKARKFIEEALEQEPNGSVELTDIAKFYRRERKYDEAIEHLKKVIELKPKSCNAHFQIGLCYRNKANPHYYPTNTKRVEDIQSALAHFEQATELKKSFVVAYIHVAEMYVWCSKFKKAEEVFYKVLNMENLTEEEKQEIHFKYGLCEEQYMKNQDEAIRHYKEVINIQKPTFIRENALNKLEHLEKRRYQQY
ncbi:interferon-induced protein with tetratricopeptide repeats 1B-like [Pelobates fuscus]|uniref:interferon-induced protein with tetratricopeptide repeats 1B-like n=1 Tax=Pelobates fuscus TaxID=191477 RepID=UPI002FE47659